MKSSSEAGLSFGDGDSGLRLGHAKIMVTRTTGALHPGVAELKGMVRQAHAAGFPVAIHAVEQEAVAAAAAVLTSERESRGGLTVRDRIEHCSECPPELVAQVVQSGAMIVTQPGFVYWQGDSYLPNVEPGLLDHLYDARGLRQAGASVAFGSDAPVIDPNPWPAIYSAVTRRTRSGAFLGAFTGQGDPCTGTTGTGCAADVHRRSSGGRTTGAAGGHNPRRAARTWRCSTPTQPTLTRKGLKTSARL